MAGTTTGVWIVLGLLLVPAAAFAGDLTQRNAAGVAFETAPLHANETFTYDVTVLSDFVPRAATAKDWLRLEVGAPEHKDGMTVATLKSTRGPAPWDVDTRPQWEDAKRRGAELTDHLHEYVDLARGQVAYQKHTTTEVQWYQHGGDTVRYAKASEGWGRPTPDSGATATLIAGQGQTWTHEVPPFGAPATPDHEFGELPLRAVIDGRTAYGATHTHTQQHPSGGAPFSCPIESPGVAYHEPVAAQAHRDEAIEVTMTHTTWRSPDIALPVRAECHATHHLSHKDKDLGHIRIILTLSDHEPGDAPLDANWQADNLYATTLGDKPAFDTAVPGLPPDAHPDGNPNTGEAFRFPLGAAYEVIHDSDHPKIDAFREGGTGPFVITEARYWTGTAIDLPCNELQDPLGAECNFAAQALRERDPERTVTPSWYLTLENSLGKEMNVYVVRNMTTGGSVIEDTVPFVSDSRPADMPRYELLPKRMVPLQTMLYQWFDDQGLDVATWRDQETLAFRFTYEDASQVEPEVGLRPTYTFLHGVFTQDGAAQAKTGSAPPGHPGGGSTSYFTRESVLTTYHGLHGSMIMEGQESFAVDGKDPGQPRFVAATVTEVTPEDHTPVVAVVVGALTLAAVAGAATPTGRNWFGLLFAPLFTKLNREQVLEHRTRDSMLTYVKQNPGVGTEEIRKHLDIGWGTAVYHLSALEQNGLLASMRQGGNRHWFAPGSGAPLDRKAIALLRSPAAKRLHDLIHATPGRTQQELAADLGVTHGAVIFQVRKLERAGLIRKERDGRFVRYYLQDGHETQAAPTPGRAS